MRMVRFPKDRRRESRGGILIGVVLLVALLFSFTFRRRKTTIVTRSTTAS